jgi:hypothetical protein
MFGTKNTAHFVYFEKPYFEKPYIKLLFVLKKMRKVTIIISIKWRQKKQELIKKTINNMKTSLEIIMERLDWFNETNTH